MTPDNSFDTQVPAAAPAALPQGPINISLRAALLSLGLAAFFGLIIPIVDMKMRNTFLGATHLPPGAIAVLLILLLVVNPLMMLVGRSAVSRYLLMAAAPVFWGTAFLLRGPAAADSKSLMSLLFWVLLALGGLAIVCFLLGKKALTRNETLTVYITCLFSCLAPGHGAENVFVVNLLGPFYYATRENKWLSFLEPYVAPWMTPALSTGGGYENNERAQNIVKDWFLGRLDGQIPWEAWLVPLCVWGFFILVMYYMMACLCSMLRKQWAEREALAFPLLRLPLKLTEHVDKPEQGVFGNFFRSPMVWSGIALVVFIQGMRGLNLYFPDFPTFPLEIDTSKLFTEAPWNQIGWVPIQIWPVVVGITFLLTAEISLSFWFFFWFVKFQLIAAYYLGYMPSSLPNAVGGMGGVFKTFTFYQQIGVYIAYVAIVMWTGREHLHHIFLRSLGRVPAGPDEKDEALSYPAAFWGFVVTFLLLVGWTMAAGVNPILAVLLWSCFVLTIVALTRIIAEAGILFVQQGWTPLATIGQITNSGANHWLLSEKSLTAAGMLQGSLMVDLRGFLMPSFIQGFKLAHDQKIALKPLLALMMACSAIALVLGVYMNVKLGYSPQGGLALDPWYSGEASRQPARVVESLAKGVKDASWFNLTWVGMGMALTYLMMVARSRLASFPLHPIGFLVAQSYPLASIWFSIFLGWFAKVTITRFGGTDSYRKVTPFFLGMVLGDVIMMLFWLVIDGWQGRVGHKLMPG